MENELLHQLRDFDPEKLAQEVVEYGNQWADADAAANVLEETKKTVYARLVLTELEQKQASGKAMPVSQAELRALAHPSYEDHLNKMVDARKRAQELRVKYDIGRAKLELYRTRHTTLRNEAYLVRNHS